MEIVRVRSYKGPVSTIGSFVVVGSGLNILALEDKDRGLLKTMPLDRIAALKVQNQTAIPTGRYQVAITFSNRFQRDMPLILNVPGFAGIRIHSGNTDADTDGCIILGLTQINNDFIANSREAFSRFYPLLKQALDRGESAFITIQ